MALVYDISRIRLPEEPKRMDCLLFAFCVKGQAEYTVDTIHHTISAGQIIIIGIKQVVSGVHFSDDCIGRGVFISENYTREILSGMRDLSSIFLFSRMHPGIQHEQRRHTEHAQLFSAHPSENLRD